MSDSKTFIFAAVDRTRGAVDSVRKRMNSVDQRFEAVRARARKMGSEIKKSMDESARAVGRFGDKAKRVGRDFSMKFTAPILAAGIGILAASGNFEAAMNRVAVKTQASAEQFQMLREQSKQLGATTQFSANQVAEAQETMATAGFKVQAIYDSMPGVLNLAAAGNIELADSSRYVSGTLNQFNLAANQSGRVADVLAKGALLADQNVSDLGEATTKAAGTANAFGIELEETAAALSVMAQRGKRAEEGGVALRNFLLELKDPASKASQYLDKMGYSVTNADGSLKSISEILETFNAAGITAANATNVFQKRVAATFIDLESGQDALRAWTGELLNAGGTAEEVAQANMKGFRGELTKLKSALEGLAIAIGDSGLLGWMTDLVARLASVVSRLTETNPAMLRMLTIIAAVGAAVGPLIATVGLIASSVSSIAALPGALAGIGAGASIATGPLALIAAAIAAVVVIVQHFIMEFRRGAAWTQRVTKLMAIAGQDIMAVLEPALAGVAKALTEYIIPAIKVVGEALITGLAVAFRVVATLLRVTLVPLMEVLSDWLGRIMPTVISFATKAWDGFVRFTRQAVAKLLEYYAMLMDQLARIPGRVGEAFADSAAKLREFSEAIGDLERPASAAVLEVSSLGKSVEETGEKVEGASAWDNLLNVFRQLKVEAKGAGDEVASAGERATVSLPGVPEIISETDPATTKLTALQQRGRQVASDLENNLAHAISSIASPVSAMTELFKATWKSAIDNVAKYLSSMLTQRLVSIAAQWLPSLFGAPPVAASIGQAGAPRLAEQSRTANQTGTVINFQSLIPASTSDLVRASTGIRRSERQGQRFILGLAGA